MKKDMPKVIAERPRHGARYKQPKGYRKEMGKLDENSPKSEKIGLKWIKNWNEGKELSHHYGPLFRFLRSKVGQKWDDVYSEICEGLDRRNEAHRHVLTHVNYFVETNVQIIDGVPCYKDAYVFGRPITCNGSRYDALFVHPETGVLTLAPEGKRHRKKVRDDFKRLDADTVVHKIDGIWYKLTVQKFNTPERRYQVARVFRGNTFYYDMYHEAWDVGHRRTIRKPSDAVYYYGEPIFATAKKQLSGEEIKKLGLK